MAKIELGAVSTWVPIIAGMLGAISGLGGFGIALAALLNSRSARLDPFDLDLFKLQVEDGAALVTSVQKVSDAVNQSLNTTTKLYAVVQQVLSETPTTNEAAAVRAAEFAAVQPLQQQITTQLAELATTQDAMRKAAAVVSFVFPLDVARSLTANLPHFQFPPELSQGLNPLTQGLLAFTQRDTAGLSQAIRAMSMAKDRLSATQQAFALEEQKWVNGEAQFTCAMQVARVNHVAVSAMPRECTHS